MFFIHCNTCEHDSDVKVCLHSSVRWSDWNHLLPGWTVYDLKLCTSSGKYSSMGNDHCGDIAGAKFKVGLSKSVFNSGTDSQGPTIYA